jgi:hypothetical protein
VDMPNNSRRAKLTFDEIEGALRKRNLNVERNTSHIIVRTPLLSSIRIYKRGEEIVIEPRFGLFKMKSTLIFALVIEALIIITVIKSYHDNEIKSTVVIALIILAIVWDAYRYIKVKATKKEIVEAIDKLRHAT